MSDEQPVVGSDAKGYEPLVAVGPGPAPEALTQVVALDGPAGTGKSSVARGVARSLGWRFVDTGATYRAATLAALRAGVDLADPHAVAEAVATATIALSTDPAAPATWLDGHDVSEEIRGAAVTAAVSAVSSVPAVRRSLIALQRTLIGSSGAVVEGRDISSVVAPHARLKVYLDARPDVRAQRRASDPASRHEHAVAEVREALAEVQEALLARDARDNRTNALSAAEGAVQVDTSDLTLDQVVREVVELAAQRGLAPRADVRSVAGEHAARRAARGSRSGGQLKPRLVAASRPFGTLLFRGAFRVTVVGTEHLPLTGPVLLAGNHTGFLDGPLAFAYSPRPAVFLAKSELFVGPLARALGWLGQIPVHRGSPDRAALRAGLAVLRAGGALGVFPEGTRGSGQLDRVSDGVGYLALRSGVPIVPLALMGTVEAMPRGARLPRWRAPITLVFGAPFTLEVDGDPRSRRTVGAAAEQIRLALLAHLRASAAEHAPRRERER